MTPFLVWYGHTPAGAPRRTVSGLSLARRAVLSAQAAGFARIVVAVRETDLAIVRAGLFADRRIRADLTVLEASGPPSDAVRHLGPGDGDVVVALGDRVWVPAVLRELLAPLAPGRAARLLVASDPAADAAPSGAAGVPRAEARGSDPGAGADDEPSGLVRVRAALLDRLPLGRGLEPAAVAEALADEGGVEPQAVGAQWRPVRQPGHARDAETLLLRALIKPADGMVARNINRKISTTLSRYLARRTIVPNQVSAVVLLIGLCSGPFAWQGGWLGLALGGLCYYVSSVLDGCDGELARLKYLSSPLGVWVDTLVDDTVGLSFLCGLYRGLDRGWGHPYWGWIGLVVVGSYLLTILPRYWLFVARIGVGDHQKLAAETRPTEAHGLARAFQLVKENIFRIDFLTFSAMVTCVLGAPFVFAACYAPGSVAGFVDTLFMLARYRRKPAPARA